MSRLHPQAECHAVEKLGWLRAAVLGANDGTLSTGSLIVGVASSHATHGSILVAGLSALVAGALSMAAGEYVSVSSQADSEYDDIAREKQELAMDWDGEVAEFAGIYRERGLDEDVSRQVAWGYSVSAELQDMDSKLKAFLENQISELEQRIEGVIAQAAELSAKAELLRSIPGIGSVSIAMLLAEMPELGRMTATEAAAMTGVAPMSHDNGAIYGKRVISRERRSLCRVLFQAGLAASCHNPVLKVVAKRMKDRGKSHKLIIIAITRRLVTIANAVFKTGLPWRITSVA